MKFGYFFTDFPEFTKQGEIKFLKSSLFLYFDNKYGALLFDTGSIYDTKSLLFFLKTYFNLYPEDIKWVFITHMHPDHIGGNRLFKNAKIVFSKKEYEFTNNIAQAVFKGDNLLKYLHENCPGYKNYFTQHEADNMQRYIENYWSKESLGFHLNPVFIEENPSIPEIVEIVPTPGHTFFHYSYLIRTQIINILITGDALSMKMILRDEENDERLLEPHMDFTSYFKSLMFIKNFDGIIVPGHDRPFFSTTLKSLRKNYYDENEFKKILLQNKL